MKKGSFGSRRLRYGGLAVAFTCALVVVVLLLNGVFSMLAEKFLWYTDLTSEEMYTLSDAAVDALKSVDKDVTILFCDDPDNLNSDYTQRLVYQTALGLEEKLDYVHVETVNIWRQPSAVNRFKTNSKDNIYSTDVIVYSGTEFRVYSLRAMYVFNEATDTEPWSYNGEKKLVSGILAVTQAESPIACITYNHGEPFSTAADISKSQHLISLLEDAGYIINPIDLANNDIPEDCRLMVVYDPQADFLVKDGVSDKSEIEKLDRFLDGTNALMVFVDPTTPVLPNLEEYLEEWGVTFNRYTDTLGSVFGTTVRDSANSLTEDGMTVVGQYTTLGLGASLHSDMRQTYPPKVIFKNAMGLTYAKSYEETWFTDEQDSSITFKYGSYASNGVYRSIYDVFTSYPTAEEVSDTVVVNKATALDPIKLMTVTRESRMVSNTDEDYSYVLACGSTDFLSSTLLLSNVYGNTDVMLSALRAMGKELVPVGITHKPFASTAIESLTTAEANRYTAVLVIIPAVASLVAGFYVLVRRKYV